MHAVPAVTCATSALHIIFPLVVTGVLDALSHTLHAELSDIQCLLWPWDQFIRV